MYQLQTTLATDIPIKNYIRYECTNSKLHSLRIYQSKESVHAPAKYIEGFKYQPISLLMTVIIHSYQTKQSSI